MIIAIGVMIIALGVMMTDDDCNKGTDNCIRGTDDCFKGTDDCNKGTDSFKMLAPTRLVTTAIRVPGALVGDHDVTTLSYGNINRRLSAGMVGDAEEGSDCSGHICAGTGLSAAHICTGTGLAPATSAPGLGSPAATSAPGLRSRIMLHLRRDRSR